MDLLWTGERLLIAGPDATAAVTTLGRDGCLGLRLPPGLMPQVLGIPAHLLLNQRVPAEEALPRYADEEVSEQLADRDGAAFERFVRTRLRARARPGWIPLMLSGLTASRPITEIADDVGFSERQLRRLSRDAFGYGPKTLARILRFGSAVALARAGTAGADVAARSGYADQAHLARDVRQLSGVTLRQLISPSTDTVTQDRAANRSTELPSGSSRTAYRCPQNASHGSDRTG